MLFNSPLSEENNMKWIIERQAFKDNHELLAQALQENDIDFIDWNADWAFDNRFPKLTNQTVIFHGSLGHAAMIVQKGLWNPGAFCNVEAFTCTAWYEQASKWLFQQNWQVSTVQKFVGSPDVILENIGEPFFVRPNSPLKPFSGRVLTKERLSLEALDFGFYYDDPAEEIIICSAQDVLEEWRFVICNQEVVTGSGYLADNRKAFNRSWAGKPLELAKEIAKELSVADPVYILDICNSKDGLKLLELNPFSGADLYGCDRTKIITSIQKLYRDKI